MFAHVAWQRESDEQNPLQHWVVFVLGVVHTPPFAMHVGFMKLKHMPLVHVDNGLQHVLFVEHCAPSDLHKFGVDLQNPF